MLSQIAQRACRHEAEVDGQSPSIAVFGQVCEGLKGLLEGRHRLAERGADIGPRPGLLAQVTALAHTSPRRAWYARRSTGAATRSPASASSASTRRAWSARRQGVQTRLGLGIDPVQVLAGEEHRLDLTFAHEDPSEHVQGALAALGRLERLPLWVLDRQIEE